jgi:glycosyltransferase involved in cell wall biosynthesis
VIKYEDKLMNSPADDITPLILTYNEEPNIARTLERLSWAKQIVGVDSFSSDATVDIVRGYPQIRLLQRKFDTFAGQCNFGIDNIMTSWVLSLDADYVLSEELVNEIQQLDLSKEHDGYSVHFEYCVFGQSLRGTLYPPRTVLYKKAQAHYEDDGHGHRVCVRGDIASLQFPVYHDDRKSFSRWLQSQDRYMIIEAKKLNETPRQELNLADRIRKTKVLAPLVVFFYCLFAKGMIFDGWPGWYYTLQRVLAETVLALRLVELEKLQKS